MLFPGLFLGWGCKSLKHVNDFSTAAEKSISGYEALPYSYRQHCLDLCAQKYEEEILAARVNFSPSDDPVCDCATDNQKDDDANKAYTALLLYFTGLEKLSAGGQFVYKSADLTAAMIKVKAISDPKMQAPVNSIADIIINMASTAYREHVLEKILNDSREPIDNLLQDLMDSNKILEKDYEGYYSRYLHLMTIKYAGAQRVSPWEQMNDFITNGQEKAKVKAVDEKLENFNVQLQKIKETHLKLANERMNLKDKDLVTYLFTQASQLKTNISKL
jgi:hypothetical protein